MSEEPKPQPQTPEVVAEPTPSPPTSTPYRTPPETLPVAAPRPLTRATIWGPSLLVFGVWLWAFVVMGELVTSYAPGGHSMLLGEATAVTFMLFVGIGAWAFALGRSLRSAPASGLAGSLSRALGLGAVSFLLWCGALIVAVIVGHVITADGFVVVLLLALAAGAFFYGERLSASGAGPSFVVLRRALWGGVGVVTFAALIAHAAS